jgi:mannose-1-phosphate guanylyltransferase
MRVWHGLCTTVIDMRVTLRRSADAHVTHHLWGVVLGGGLEARHRGDGSCARLRCPTLLTRTLERAARLIPVERLVTVVARGQTVPHGLPSEINRVVQPAWRGTAAETYLPVLKIAAADPEAVVVLFPGSYTTDGEGRLMSHVAKAVAAVAIRPDLPIVLGASPRGPDVAAAWIEPGSSIDDLERYAVRTVRRFLPRPSPAELVSLWEGDGLVNTRVVIAKARTLIGLGHRYLPDVLETFEPLETAFGAPEETLLCEAVYEQMPYASITHALFARTDDVAVLPVTQVRMWVDRPAAAPALAS